MDNVCPNCAQDLDAHATWCLLHRQHSSDEAVMAWWLEHVFPNLEDLTFH